MQVHRKARRGDEIAIIDPERPHCGDTGDVIQVLDTGVWVIFPFLEGSSCMFVRDDAYVVVE